MVTNHNNPIVTFNYGDHPVRMEMVDGEPWFCAADVCEVLDIKQATRALKRIDDDEKGVISIHTPGGTQEVLGVNEPGLYSLVLGSRKKEAKDFKRWITHEVLPAIRKTGQYQVQPHIAGTHPSDPFLQMLDGVKALYIEQQEMKSELGEVKNRVNSLEEDRNRSREAAWALPAPTVSAEMSKRDLCRTGIDDLAALTGKGHQELWRKAYHDYDYLTKSKVTVLAQNRNMGKLDYIDKHGDIDALYGVIKSLLDKAA